MQVLRRLGHKFARDSRADTPRLLACSSPRYCRCPRRVRSLGLSTFKLICLLMAGLLVAPAAQASGSRSLAWSAETPVTVVGSTSALKINAGSCRTPIRYTVSPGWLPEGGSYDVKAILRDKHGSRFGSDEAWLEEGASYRGRIFPRCGSRLTTGTYSIDVKVVVNDDYLSPVETRSGSTTVRLAVTRPAPTTLVVLKEPYGSAGWQWTGRLTSRGKPLAGQRIDLWWDFLGWEDYEVSKMTNRSGIAHWVSNPNGAAGGINFRLRFKGTAKYAPSQSAVFNIAPR